MPRTRIPSIEAEVSQGPTAQLPTGLASAEQELFTISRSSGEVGVQRQVLQFRVDYLAQLNTQTMLVAGAAVGMFSSLELEAMQAFEGEFEGEGWMTDTSRVFFSFVSALTCFMYVVCAAVSLGSSIWVLYTSNNLINLATTASLYASDLKQLQWSDKVIGQRMLDVRAAYFYALVTLVPPVLFMAFKLVAWHAWLGASLIVAFALVHAIHTDYESEHKLMEACFAHLDLNELRPEWAIEKFVHKGKQLFTAFVPRF